MPTYEYRCDRGHTFEVFQRMSDDPLTTCTACDSSVRRVLHPVAVHFKGSGFHNTDYGKRGRTDAGEGSDGAGKSEKASSPESSKSTDSGASSGDGGGSSGGGDGSSSSSS
ncbi:MAG: FmdB family transcriptional regulator [Actinomycetota bacterium]|nr:FmdB family transcriptional regulator [Actinomycetota bacterium]